MTALDSSWLKFWESVGELGFVFVWVGVAGEGVEIFIKLFRPKLYEKKKFCLDIIGAVFWMILVAALAVEFWGNHKAMQLADSLNAKLNSKAAEAIERAATTELQVAVLSNQTVRLAIDLEGQKSNNLVLQQQLEPRIISEYAMIPNLTNFAGIQAAIIVAPGNECSDIAEQIGKTLRGAGWDFDRIFVTERPVASGISVGVCSTNRNFGIFGVRPPQKSEAELAANALVSELNKNNVDTVNDPNINFATHLRFNGVLVIVGPKPIGLEARVLKAKVEWQRMEAIADEAEAKFSIFSPQYSIALRDANEAMEKWEELQIQLPNRESLIPENGGKGANIDNAAYELP